MNSAYYYFLAFVGSLFMNGTWFQARPRNQPRPNLLAAFSFPFLFINALWSNDAAFGSEVAFIRVNSIENILEDLGILRDLGCYRCITDDWFVYWSLIDFDWLVRSDG
jgi:hypothetical protein